MKFDDDERAVERFKQFLRIKTVSAEGPSGSYQEAVDFLIPLLEEIGLSHTTYEFVPGKPVLMATWTGSDPSLPGILLNSHYDVVPAVDHMWTLGKPFEANETKDGEIVGRGTQDMKPVCIQYIEAVRRLKYQLLRAQRSKSNSRSSDSDDTGDANSRTDTKSAMATSTESEAVYSLEELKAVQLKRSVFLTFMPDEEIGGIDGMKAFLTEGPFSTLNIGMSLDEGIASTDDSFTFFYGERAIWWLKVTAQGPTGHASRFIPRPAMEKLVSVIQHFLVFKRTEEEKLSASSSVPSTSHAHGVGCKHALAHKLGDVITLNLTALKGGVCPGRAKEKEKEKETDNGNDKDKDKDKDMGNNSNNRSSSSSSSSLSLDGYALNVVPMEACAGFDIRIPPSIDLKTFEGMIKAWCQAEENVSYDFILKTAGHQQGEPRNNTTSLDVEKNNWYRVFKSTLEDKLNMKINPEIFPAATDGRYLREIGIPVFGFSPINRTHVLMHDHDERISRQVFLNGVRVYQRLVEELAESPRFDTEETSDAVDSTLASPDTCAGGDGQYVRACVGAGISSIAGEKTERDRTERGTKRKTVELHV